MCVQDQLPAILILSIIPIILFQHLLASAKRIPSKMDMYAEAFWTDVEVTEAAGNEVVVGA
jgi:hypothetical protein